LTLPFVNKNSLTWLKFSTFISHLSIDLRKKWLEISVSLLIIIGIITGGYFLFFKGAVFLNNQGEIGGILLNRVFYLGWSIIFYLLILSNIITSFSTLYRSPEVFFLMTMPIEHHKVFMTKFVENLVYSSWAILILGLPLSIAYGRVNLLSGFEIFLTMTFGLIPLLIICSILGLTITMAVVYLSRWFRIRSMFIVLGILFTIGFWLYFSFSQKGIVMGGDFGSFRALDRYVLNMSRTPFPFIPSHWFSQLFVAYSDGNLKDFIYFAGQLFVNALLGIELSRWLAGKLYFRSFQIMEFSGYGKRICNDNEKLKSIRLRWLEPQTRGLVIKDLIQFVRTPQQWIQFLFFGFFIGIYLINLIRIDFHLENFAPMWRILVYVFNFGFVGFIIAALTSRFVFPLISMEGQALWVLLSAPVNISKLFREKFWLAFAAFFTLAEIVALASNYFLSRGLFDTLLSTLFLMLISLALISLSLGLGTVFAQYSERNPMKISSSAGGIITIVISMIYVGIMVGLLVWLLWLGEKNANPIIMLAIISAVFVLNAVIIYIPLRWGYRSICKTEL